jgi:protein TonB
MQERSGLALALSCSLLGHAVLLFAMPLPPPLQTPRLSGAIEVRLRVGKTFASTPAPFPENPTATAKPASVPQTPAPSRTAVAPSPRATTPAPAPLPPPAVPATMPNSNPVQENGDLDAGEGAAQATVIAPLAAVDGAGGGSRQGEEAPEGMGDALQDYRFAISRAAARFKRYPALARARGREGRVDVRLVWRPGMRAPQVELQASAGDTLLDEQGLAMLRQAAAQTPLPDILRARAFSLLMPVEFSLKDAN